MTVNEEDYVTSVGSTATSGGVGEGSEDVYLQTVENIQQFLGIEGGDQTTAELANVVHALADVVVHVVEALGTSGAMQAYSEATAAVGGETIYAQNNYDDAAFYQETDAQQQLNANTAFRDELERMGIDPDVVYDMEEQGIIESGDGLFTTPTANGQPLTAAQFAEMYRQQGGDIERN
jgi:hypothetical protein